jgi:hypothetical protein
LTAEAFRLACRKEFAFLTQSYGFIEQTLVPDERLDQVVFEKLGWRIAVVGTAHGTRASIVIHSPDGRRGFFSHLIEPQFEKQKRSEFGKGQLGDIGFKACCLRTYGAAFLNGEWQGFDFLLQKQRKFILASGIMSKLT